MAMPEEILLERAPQFLFSTGRISREANSIPHDNTSPFLDILLSPGEFLAFPVMSAVL